ncbi:ATP-binding protein [Methanospirillum lacunae]|uniref:ATP-binding protein n=1 Tax=Methanospirillum lacunae TaxID=668570 RepID=A0A2V2N8P3_9EURY|nr:ATP-binding protein [Methanospirillum lacunae]PWR72878.1 ATP-binding protein [Methanospirillum lacunae]
MVTIRQNERNAIIKALQAGVSPRIGLQHIQVGRKEEILAILKDIDNISKNGSAARFIIGPYGSGKSFFLNLCRMLALEKDLVVLQTDITIDKRLHGSNSQARMLYATLMQNMAIKTKPNGGALASIVERWISDIDFNDKQLGKSQDEIIRHIRQELTPLQAYVNGFDFTIAISRYYEGFYKEDDILMASAIRWLSGEYSNKTDAKDDLGVKNIISDQNIYDYLKLWAKFVQMAGYKGLIICLDEMGVLSHRLNNSIARNSNYEIILQIYNESEQGVSEGIGFFFAGFDKFIYDTKRGLISYGAFESRLKKSKFIDEGLKDFSGPVIELQKFTFDENLELLRKIRHVYALGDNTKYLISDDGIAQYQKYCSEQLGSEFFLTPRDIIIGYVKILSILEQNPEVELNKLIKLSDLQVSKDPDLEDISEEELEKPSDNELKHFSLNKQT